jgi:lipoprotein-anchoring transpeptidase ErfK/SrfK
MADSTTSRRAFLAGALALGGGALAGCSSITLGNRTVDFGEIGDKIGGALSTIAPNASMYASVNDDGHRVPSVPLGKLKAGYGRTEVAYDTGERPGTIVVETSKRYLYLQQANGRAVRYGIGVGRDGFRWSGRAVVGRKAKWPTWTPPPAMMERQPETRRYANGMPGGINNPLGARALYIYQDGRDTIYRLHGTNEPLSIGQAMSSGCVRLINQDVIDLYGRCPVGTPIVVRA